MRGRPDICTAFMFHNLFTDFSWKLHTALPIRMTLGKNQQHSHTLQISSNKKLKLRDALFDVSQFRPRPTTTAVHISTGKAPSKITHHIYAFTHSNIQEIRYFLRELCSILKQFTTNYHGGNIPSNSDDSRKSTGFQTYSNYNVPSISTSN